MTVEPSSIRSTRFDLVSMSRLFLAASLEGRHEAAAAELGATVVRAPIRRMVGHIDSCDPPQADRSVEVGYAVEVPDRRNGYALEAIMALCRWAAVEHGILRCRASISPDNAPSLRLVEKLGFVQAGERWDEIVGLELVFTRNLSRLLVPD